MGGASWRWTRLILFDIDGTLLLTGGRRPRDEPGVCRGVSDWRPGLRVHSLAGDAWILDQPRGVERRPRTPMNLAG